MANTLSTVKEKEYMLYNYLIFIVCHVHPWWVLSCLLGSYLSLRCHHYCPVWPVFRSVVTCGKANMSIGCPFPPFSSSTETWSNNECKRGWLDLETIYLSCWDIEVSRYRHPRLQWHSQDQHKVSLQASVTLTTSFQNWLISSKLSIFKLDFCFLHTSHGLENVQSLHPHTSKHQLKVTSSVLIVLYINRPKNICDIQCLFVRENIVLGGWAKSQQNCM